MKPITDSREKTESTLALSGRKPKIDALRRRMFKKLREINREKRCKVPQEIGVPYIDPHFGRRDADLDINLEDESEEEWSVESGDD